MALKFSTDLKNYIVNQGVVKQMAGTMGTGGTATLSIYTGSQPASADSPATGVLLCTISGIGWGTSGSAGTIGATAGTSYLQNTAGYTGTSATGGTVGWARMETFGTGFTGSAGTFRIDGNVGTAATCTFVIDQEVFSDGVAITLSNATIYLS